MCLRNLIAKFLIQNKSFEIKGISLLNIIGSEFSSITNFIENSLCKQKIPPKILIIAITPIVLRISLDCITLDINNLENNENPIIETFFAMAPGFHNVLGDGLDFHDENISILVNPADYAILYSSKYWEIHGKIIENSENQKIDLEFMKNIEKQREKLDESNEKLFVDLKKSEGYDDFSELSPSKQIFHCKKMLNNEENKENEWLLISHNIDEKSLKTKQEFYVIRELLFYNFSKKIPLFYRCCECEEEHLKIPDLSWLNTDFINKFIDNFKNTDFKNIDPLLFLQNLCENTEFRNEKSENCLKCEKCKNILKIKLFPNLYKYRDTLIPFYCENCKFIISYKISLQIYDEILIKFLLLNFCCGCGVFLTNYTHILPCFHYRCEICQINKNPCNLCKYINSADFLCSECCKRFDNLHVIELECSPKYQHYYCMECNEKNDSKKCKFCNSMLFKVTASILNMKRRMLN